MELPKLKRLLLANNDINDIAFDILVRVRRLRLETYKFGLISVGL